MRSPKTDMNLDSLITEFDRGLRSLSGVVRASRPSPAAKLDLPATATATAAAPDTSDIPDASNASGADTADTAASEGVAGTAAAAPGVLTLAEKRHAAGL